MPCDICEKGFTIFMRRSDCTECGVACCDKCIKYKFNDPTGGKRKICRRCYNRRRSVEQSDSEASGVKSSSSENPEKPPIVMYKQSNHWDTLRAGLEPVDQEIADRLKKLKDEDKEAPAPSVEELSRRLALLKDQDPDAASNNRVNVNQVDIRTDQEKVDDLIKEYLEGLEIDIEVQKRLRSLRGEDKNTFSQEAANLDDDEETVTKRLIKKAIAEGQLEAKYSVNPEEDLDEMQIETAHKSDDEDKPTCVMCDQTVDLVRCLGCTGDLYCPICFEDNHDDFEMGKHKTLPFVRTKEHSPE